MTHKYDVPVSIEDWCQWLVFLERLRKWRDSVRVTLRDCKPMQPN